MATDKGTRMGPERRPLDIRFWAKVDKSEGPDGCWLWMGGRNAKGYGKIGVYDGSGVMSEAYAHRTCWVLHNGPVPAGRIVRHTCDNPPCVNPDHLETGTYTDNNNDSVRRGRWNSGARGTRGEGHHKAVLTRASVERFRARYWAGGVTQRELAAEGGVSQSAMSKALRGGTWKQV